MRRGSVAWSRQNRQVEADDTKQTQSVEAEFGYIFSLFHDTRGKVENLLLEIDIIPVPKG